MHSYHRPRLCVIVGTSGAGKSFVENRLLRAFPNLVRAVSTTTRAPRPGEREGRDYNFVTPESFQQMCEAGEMAEWASYDGHSYGTVRASIQNPLIASDVVKVVDTVGADAIRNIWPNCWTVFIDTPSILEQEQRLHDRGNSAVEIARRMNHAQTIERPWAFHRSREESLRIHEGLPRRFHIVYSIVKELTVRDVARAFGLSTDELPKPKLHSSRPSLLQAPYYKRARSPVGQPRRIDHA